MTKRSVESCHVIVCVILATCYFMYENDHGQITCNSSSVNFTAKFHYLQIPCHTSAFQYLLANYTLLLLLPITLLVNSAPPCRKPC